MREFLLFITVICLFMLFFWLTAPTTEDVQACKSVTGWSESKCRLELGK